MRVQQAVEYLPRSDYVSEVVTHAQTVRKELIPLVQVKRLLKGKVTCASPAFVVDWLAHPAADLQEHLLYGTKAAAGLHDMMSDRGKSLDAAEQSMSY